MHESLTLSSNVSLKFPREREREREGSRPARQAAAALYLADSHCQIITRKISRGMRMPKRATGSERVYAGCQFRRFVSLYDLLQQLRGFFVRERASSAVSV